MPKENKPGTRFPKNKLYKLAQKYRANFSIEKKESVLPFWDFVVLAVHSHLQINCPY